ncbi:hypothetical protein CONCODRAFT_12690 [Conidiobolus coronatus NRRL 28638]|uniref:Uncharacterized protein n=1 Tax=Conidiobolus coronatus (strain ATCC 28846 / CBS 209.66 / NRRL 28638) TaxID=796925 RepID=A0A137NSD2_CONC2|nr:hypothetical protein CONCODRAFT_12690 [Conidiobolus coronatus NRRL 28638]|eukprot:KXN65646.1 hypothetical protein CONCODRAFT_12690 [Conidiobolus coronatus NRRL 28638]
MFIGVNITFFPMHFLGLAGKGNPRYFNEEKLTAALCAASILISTLVLIEVDNYVINGALSLSLKHKKNIIQIPYGPHIKPIWLNKPVRLYNNPNKDKNIIGSDNKKRSIIYQWTNLITGKIYVGSA